MKKFLIFLLLVGTIEAQQYRGQQNTSFSAVSTAPTINLTASGVNWHNIIWTISGTVSTCSVQVDSSADGVTWSAGGVITSQTCTSNGNSTYVNVVASYIRVNLTVLTGGGSVNVTWTGYGANPQSSGGSVTQVATSSPITGGTITTTGTVACATCVTASSPGAGVAHFAGSTQAVTSSAVALASDVSGQLPIGNVGSAGLSGTGGLSVASTGVVSSTGPYPICKFTVNGNTADTNSDILGQCTIPAGTMGTTSRLMVDAEFNTVTGGATCVYAIYWSNSASASSGTGFGSSTAATGQRAAQFTAAISNQGSVSSQYLHSLFSSSTGVNSSNNNGGTAATYNTSTTTTYVTLQGAANAATANTCNILQGMVLLIP